MKFNPDDPKWTAYVLGELTEGERAAVEKELEYSAAAREAVEEIRMTSILLRDELESTAATALLPEQRRAIHAKVISRPSFRTRFFPIAAAAGLMAAVLTLPLLVNYLDRTEPGIYNRTEQAANDVSPEHSAPVESTAILPGSSREKEQEARQGALAKVMSPDTGTVTGTVKDSTGAVLPGATITVTRQETGMVLNTVADATGSYVLPNVPSGPYRVEAQLPGFRTYVENDVLVQGNSTPAINPVLQVGQIAEAVEIVQAKALADEIRASYVARDAAPSVSQSARAAMNANTFSVPVAPLPAPASAASLPRSVDAVDNRQRFNTETYDQITDNPFIRVAQDSLATFSTDVDTASYANVRRFLGLNQLPPKDSVRIEEMVNYFTYDYAAPTGSRPLAIYTEVASAPWKPEHRLVRIGIKGKEINLSKVSVLNR